jgi:hypothetical protein
MAINVTKPAINLREKLNEVTLETGIKGEELLNSDTSTEARNVLELDTHLFTDFESTGIDDNATSTAITIDANENVGVGQTSPITKLDASQDNIGGNVALGIFQSGNAYGNVASSASLYLGATYHSLANSAKITSTHSSGTTGDHAQDLTFNPINAGSTSFEAMRIDSAGRVTMPNQPAFDISIGTSYEISSSALVQFQTERFDKGNNFNTSTYKFTAPVDGVYHFTSMLEIDSITSNTWYYYAFNVNGVLMNGIDHQTDSTTYHKAIAAQSFDLNANDSVAVHWHGGAFGTIQPAATFSGHLVG